jgi:cytidylate kinase
VAPLIPAPDALVIDSTHLTIEAVEAQMMDFIRAQGVV